jgi:hypothetical protein
MPTGLKPLMRFGCRPCSNFTLLAWVVFYWILLAMLKIHHVKWQMQEWDVDGEKGQLAHTALDNMTNWSAHYGYDCTCMHCTCSQGVTHV